MTATILDTLRRLGDTSARELVQVTGLTHEAVYAELVRLEAAGRVRMLAKTGGTRCGFTWAAIEDCPAPAPKRVPALSPAMRLTLANLVAVRRSA